MFLLTKVVLFKTPFSRDVYKASCVTMNTEYIYFLREKYTKRNAKR